MHLRCGRVTGGCVGSWPCSMKGLDLGLARIKWREGTDMHASAFGSRVAAHSFDNTLIAWIAFPNERAQNYGSVVWIFGVAGGAVYVSYIGHMTCLI